MRIKDTRGNEYALFKDLLYGELFEDEDTNICIRIGTICNEFGSWNAVNLSDGEPTCFDDDDRVARLNAELVISW